MLAKGCIMSITGTGLSKSLPLPCCSFLLCQGWINNPCCGWKRKTICGCITDSHCLRWLWMHHYQNSFLRFQLSASWKAYKPGSTCRHSHKYTHSWQLHYISKVPSSRLTNLCFKYCCRYVALVEAVNISESRLRNHVASHQRSICFIVWNQLEMEPKKEPGKQFYPLPLLAPSQ